MKPELNPDNGKWEFVMFGKVQSYDTEDIATEYWMLFQNWMFSDSE